MLFQLESKKFESVATQTGKNLDKSGGTLRIRERIERQETEMTALVRAATQARAAAIASAANSLRRNSGNAHATSLQRKDSMAAQSASLQRKDSMAAQSATLQRKDSNVAQSASLERKDSMATHAATLQRKDSNVAQSATLQRKDSTTATSLQRKDSTTTHEAGVSSSSLTRTTAAAYDPTAAVALTPTEVVQEIARIYVQKIHADAENDEAKHSRQDLVPFIKDTYLMDLGFKATAQKKLAQLVVSATEAGHTQEKVRIKWFLRFVRAGPKTMRLHRVALDFYLLALQRLIPLGQLQFRLEDEPYHACLVPYATMKDMVDDPLVSRLLVSKDQRQQLLMLQVSERDALLGTAAATATSVSSSGPSIVPRRRDSALPAQLQRSPSAAMLHIDDILDSTMNVWLQYQARYAQHALSLSCSLWSVCESSHSSVLAECTASARSGPCSSSA